MASAATSETHHLSDELQPDKSSMKKGQTSAAGLPGNPVGGRDELIERVPMEHPTTRMSCEAAGGGYSTS